MTTTFAKSKDKMENKIDDVETLKNIKKERHISEEIIENSNASEYQSLVIKKYDSNRLNEE